MKDCINNPRGNTGNSAVICKSDEPHFCFELIGDVCSNWGELLCPLLSANCACYLSAGNPDDCWCDYETYGYESCEMVHFQWWQVTWGSYGACVKGQATGNAPGRN